MKNLKEVDSGDVYEWPEFKAFVARLGLANNMRHGSFTLYLNDGEGVRVIQEYRCGDVMKVK